MAGGSGRMARAGVSGRHGGARPGRVDPDLPGPDLGEGGHAPPAGYATSEDGWLDPRDSLIYRATGVDVRAVSACLNNAWWFAGGWAVYQDEDGNILLRERARTLDPMRLAAARRGESVSLWRLERRFPTLGYTTADGSGGTLALAQPCLAVATPSGSEDVAVAFIGPSRELIVAHSDDAFAETTITSTDFDYVRSPSMVMDEAGVLYVVFVGMQDAGTTDTSDDAATGVYLVVRSRLGLWSTPSVVNTMDPDPMSGDAVSDLRFPSVAVSGQGVSLGSRSVLVTYTVLFTGRSGTGRIRGKVAHVGTLKPLRWDMATIAEQDIGDGVGLRDSCAAASRNPRYRDATFLVACVRDTGGDAPVVVVFWSDDADSASPTWTEVDLSAVGGAELREAMDFPNLAVDADDYGSSGLVVLCWESRLLDDDGEPTGPQLPSVAVANIVDPGTWTLLPGPTNGLGLTQGQLPCAATSHPGGVQVAWLSGADDADLEGTEGGDLSCQFQWRETRWR